MIEPGAFCLLDLGYLDFSRLFATHQAQGFFVTRAKMSTRFRRRYSNPAQHSTTPVVCDQIGLHSEVGQGIKFRIVLPVQHCTPDNASA